MSLEAVERSDLARLPGGIFTRAFIRAYAEEVGLDPDRTVQDFLAELPPEAATATARTVVLEDGEKLDADRRAVSTAIRLVLVSIPIIVGVIYFSKMRAPARSTPAPAVEAPHAAIAQPAAPAMVAPVAADSSAQAQPAGLVMGISPKASCWVSVTVDGEPTFSSLMMAGETRQVTAKDEVLVTVGDAGAFAYTLNGRPGKPLGAPGEVVSTRINLSNLKDLQGP